MNIEKKMGCNSSKPNTVNPDKKPDNKEKNKDDKELKESDNELFSSNESEDGERRQTLEELDKQSVKNPESQNLESSMILFSETTKKDT